MHEVVIRRAAMIDLDGIARYTTTRWGAEQAQKYLAAIRYDIESLAAYPRRHLVYPGKHGTIHKMPSGHHVVLYRVTESQVEIARVLHERMDVPVQIDEN